MSMSWLDVIKAGRVNVAAQAADDDSVFFREGDGFEDDEGKEVELTALESAALAAALRTTASQLHILSIATVVPMTRTARPLGEKLLSIVQDTERELRRRKFFETLFASAREESRKMKEVQVLEAIAQKNKERIASLKSRLEGTEKAKHKELHKKHDTIATLKDQILDLISRRDVNLLYVEHSENSRREQNLMRCDLAEQSLKTCLHTITERTSSELRVHQDMALFLDLEMKNMNEEIIRWKNFYEDEVVRRDSKIKVLKEKIVEERGKWALLEELYEEHQKEMNDYLEYKEQKRQEAERDQFIYDSATKIQAWWRGTMVRRGLGPYKKRKKPPKDKKKKK